MVLLKKIRFYEDIPEISYSAQCAVLACVESEIEMSANPKLANIAQSRTLDPYDDISKNVE